MKSKPQLPRTGRPVKTPTPDDLKNFGPLALLIDETVKILHHCGAPSGTQTKLSKDERSVRIAEGRPLPAEKSWGRLEAVLILQCLNAPLLLDAAENDCARLRLIPLSFARLFAEAPNAMIEALPKVNRLLITKARSPKQAVAFDYALRRYKGFWNESSDYLADELKRLLRMPITARVVEHARDLVRKKTFPRKPR